MQLPQPIYKKSRNIKDKGSIVWSPTEEWLPQLTKYLTDYIANTRRKSKAHREFARELMTEIQKLPAENNQQQIIEKILPKLSNRKGLVAKGWDGKESYLYHLCDFAFIMHTAKMMAKIINQDKDQETAREKLEKDEKIGELKKSIAAREQEIKALEGRVKTVQEVYLDSVKAAEGERHQLQDTIADLTTSLSRETSKNETLILENKQQDVLISQLKNKISCLPVNITQTASPVAVPAENQQEHLAELQCENVKLTCIAEENAQRQRSIDQLTLINAKLSSKNTHLQDDLTRIRLDHSRLKKTVDLMIKFLDKLFDGCFTEKCSDYFLKYQSSPSFNVTQDRLIKKIASASGADPVDSNFAKEVETTAAKMARGEDYATPMDRIHTNVLKGFSFLSNNLQKTTHIAVSAVKDISSLKTPGNSHGDGT